VCKNLCFAKPNRLLISKLDIYIFNYNFISVHSTLSKCIDEQTGKKLNVPTTPAMKAGIAYHVWNFAELLGVSTYVHSA
jgi:hypothetical protein